VFFSSHILSDAEALCSRVAIVAQGKLMAEGRLADIAQFELRGWELVVANLGEAIKAAIERRVVSITALAEQRYTLELPPDVAPAGLLAELSAAGVQVVSLNPIRTTLEDYFVSLVRGATPRDVSGVAS
jgi:ABC-2 type transport system ATP-binding protein